MRTETLETTQLSFPRVSLWAWVWNKKAREGAASSLELGNPARNTRRLSWVSGHPVGCQTRVAGHQLTTVCGKRQRPEGADSRAVRQDSEREEREEKREGHGEDGSEKENEEKGKQNPHRRRGAGRKLLLRHPLGWRSGNGVQDWAGSQQHVLVTVRG